MNTAARRRLARSELLVFLAMLAQRHADDLAGKGGARPVAEWPSDDLEMVLCRRYGLTPADLSRVWFDLAEQFEAKALREGYEDAWFDEAWTP